MRKLDTLVAGFPDTYKLTGQDEVSKTYSFPESFIGYSKPRAVSTEQRERARQVMIAKNKAKADSPKVMAVRKNAAHGDMLYSAEGYVTAWFMWQLKGDEEAAKAFVGENPEIMNNELYQEIGIKKGVYGNEREKENGCRKNYFDCFYRIGCSYCRGDHCSENVF